MLLVDISFILLTKLIALAQQMSTIDMPNLADSTAPDGRQGSSGRPGYAPERETQVPGSTDNGRTTSRQNLDLGMEVENLFHGQ
jgi:hypothetical protein